MGGPDHSNYLEAGKEKRFFRAFPDDLPSGYDKELFDADVYFYDANQVGWRATTDGGLAEGSPEKR